MHRVVAITLLALAVTFPATSDAVDLTGRWYFEAGVNSIVSVTQSGSALSIPFVFPFTGTIGATDPNGFTPYQVSWTDGTTMAAFDGRVTPSGTLLDGRGVSYGPSGISAGGIVATRCTCFDGNSTNGDGCDATCQVEPCWTCVGDPSVCTPTLDGGACDDGNPCTTGETCSSGVCAGGAPVTPPCFYLAGLWSDHYSAPDVLIWTDTMITAIQRGSDLRLGPYVGVIDPATGTFDIRSPNPNLFCWSFDPLMGAVAADGLTYSATGSVQVPEPCCPDQCIQASATDFGDHCGDGNLDAGETCDDGNLQSGDGCSARCNVEVCWMCSGIPSTCAPATGDPCDDGNACTSGDTCVGPFNCAGTPVTCGPCLSCDSSAGCVAAPQSVCKASTVPDKSLLSLKNNADDTKDRFNWRWKKGADTDLSELGDPSNNQDLTVCLYDDSSATPALLFRATIPAGGLWTPTGTGFRYKDANASADGVLVAALKSGLGGKASVKVKGKGIHLSDRPYGTPAPALPLPLRVQLQGTNGLCVETRHDTSSVVKNDAASGVFKAHGVP